VGFGVEIAAKTVPVRGAFGALATMRRTTRLYYGALLVLAWQALATGCGRSAPLTFSDFVDDPIAREGTLARCNNDRAATRGDRECTEARRAAAAVAAQRQTARSEELARESERKPAAVRARAAAEERAHREARAEAEAAAAAAYDAQWGPEQKTPSPAAGSAAAGGTESRAREDSAAPPVRPDVPSAEDALSYVAVPTELRTAYAEPVDSRASFESAAPRPPSP
jgi:hypothetical protein